MFRSSGVKGYAADVDPPDAGEHLPAGEFDRDDERLAVLRFGDERQVEKIVLGIPLLLPTVHVQVLPEVPLAVHQADAAQGHAEVARRLQMVAGQDAEAARIDRHRLVDAELGREVGDAEVGLLRVLLGEPRRGGHVRLERLLHAVQVGQEPVVGRQFLEPRLRGRGEEADRAVVELLEQVGVDAAEEGDGVGVPAPPQVVGQPVEGHQVVGQAGQDGERSDGPVRHLGPRGRGRAFHGRREGQPTESVGRERTPRWTCFTETAGPGQSRTEVFIN
jgi:hypothetical protein